MGRIIGIGTDIADVERILKAVQKVSFLNKCYTDKERELIEKENTAQHATLQEKKQ